MGMDGVTWAIRLILLAVVVWLGWSAWRVYRDATALQIPPGRRLLYTLIGAIRPARYFWDLRLNYLSDAALYALAQAEAAKRGLKRIDNLRCPLCGAEIEGAWTLTSAGELQATHRSTCPKCDFRLDSCRHCRHFQPATGIGGAGLDWASSGLSADYTHGRCTVYKTMAHVSEAGLAPSMVKQLLKRGYEYIRVPQPISDSYMPLDGCRAFALEEKRLKISEIRVDPAQRGLLRALHARASSAQTNSPLQ